MIKNLPANVGDARDAGSITGSGRSPGVRNGTPLQQHGLENFLGKGPGELPSVGLRRVRRGWAGAHPAILHQVSRSGLLSLPFTFPGT